MRDANSALRKEWAPFGSFPSDDVLPSFLIAFFGTRSLNHPPQSCRMFFVNTKPKRAINRVSSIPFLGLQKWRSFQWKQPVNCNLARGNPMTPDKLGQVVNYGSVLFSREKQKKHQVHQNYVLLGVSKGASSFGSCPLQGVL